MHFSQNQRAIAIAAALALGLFVAAPASAAVSVVVNGTPVTFDQPPVERAGRVFVPLRGVFEKLGATVVYQNGQINATGNGRNISLQIGSTTATVNGQQQQLDVAPFLIGARTLVPLRFVSQALGANVDYNNSNQVVSLTMPGGNPAPVAQNPQPQQPAAPANEVRLTQVSPTGVTTAKTPLIHANFSQPVDPNSVKISLDGRDVSSTSEISPNYLNFTPSYALSANRHVVHVMGKATDGSAFDRQFAFNATGGDTATNFINNLAPGNGAKIASTFTVTGVTLPNSKVKITAIGGANVGGVFRINTGTFTTEVTADSNGRFGQQISTGDVGGGGDIGVRLTSTAPVTGASVTKTIEVHS